MSNAYKILVTSQKGGVGKSTLSVNLVAYLRQIGNKRTALVDLDHQATSSKWLKGASSNDEHSAAFKAERGVSLGLNSLNVAKAIRHAASLNDVVITDLTWNDFLPKEFFFDFDLLLIPCSLSSVELDSTMEFLNRISHILHSKFRNPPALVIVPSRIKDQEDYSRILKKAFSFEFYLAPPVAYNKEIQDYFCSNFLFESESKTIRENFINFAESVEDLIRSSQYKNSQAALPQSAHRDAGTVLDRFLLLRTAQKNRQEKIDHLEKTREAQRKNFMLPSFLTKSNRVDHTN